MPFDADARNALARRLQREGAAEEVAQALDEVRRDSPELFHQPIVFVSPRARQRHKIRWIDPVEATTRPDRAPGRPTAYRADRVLVRGDGTDVAEAIRRLPADVGGPFTVDVRNVLRDPGLFDGLVDDAGQAEQQQPPDRPSSDLDLPGGDEPPRGEVAEALWRADVSVLEISRTGDDSVEPVDAWEIIQVLDPALGKVHLDHVHGIHETSAHPMTAHPMTAHPMTAHPMTAHPMTAHSGNGVVARYAVPGMGGRTPVAWEGDAPTARTFDDGERPPVVVIADTGIGTHPWLPPEPGSPEDHSSDTGGANGPGGVVVHDAQVGPGRGRLLGPTTPDEADLHENPEGWSNPLVGALDAATGHGTFMAGLVRQQCPSARILGVRLFGGDGTITDSVLVPTLQRLVARQWLAVTGVFPEAVLDVVCLSLGTYVESPDDEKLVEDMAGPLRALGLLGVTVVVSAGNDATLEPAFPAAFAAGGLGLPASHTVAPQVTVGATNPDGTAALFSNEGPWVGHWQRGVALVSTYPIDLDGSVDGGASIMSPWGRPRSGFDLDDYGSGFAVWSGTSFAGPSFAGLLADGLLKNGLTPGVDLVGAVQRSWKVVRALTGLPFPDTARAGGPEQGGDTSGGDERCGDGPGAQP